jgi:hypothetical protein
MRLVRQQDRSGCGIACVAMLARLTYEQVRAAYVGFSKRREFNLIACGSGAGMRWGEVVALLWRLRVPPSLDKIYIERREHGGHYVVIDSRGKVFDPA